MSTFTRSITETFHVVSCYTCGVTFGIGDELYRCAVQDMKRSVYCPACGNGTRWTGKTEADKLREQLARERAKHDQTRADRDRIELRRRAAKAQLTKTRNRISRGVCPCCNRHFENLQRHIETKHPEYTADDQ